mgnify:CR=1 FL=1
MKVIYTGWPSLKLTPDLAVEDDERSRHYGWLFAKHPDGQWVTLADLKPLAIRANDPTPYEYATPAPAAPQPEREATARRKSR